jgi:hypothetical protein
MKKASDMFNAIQYAQVSLTWCEHIILCTPSKCCIFQTSSSREFHNWKMMHPATTRNLCKKKLTKTHVITEILDKNFSKDIWTVHPSIIPFLANIMVNFKKHLHPYVAPVNNNFFNEAKALNIAHTMLGNFCHGDKDKESHMENMGNDACVVVGFNNMVRIHQHLFLFTIQQYH